MEWIMNPDRYYHKHACRNEFGLLGGSTASVPYGNMVDLESNLKGIDRDASRCPTMHFLPRDDGIAVGAHHFRNCGRSRAVDTAQHHLKSCQFVAHEAVPAQPQLPYQPFVCRR
jgi:hypothetical protein